jgi:hypothetical protein
MRRLGLGSLVLVVALFLAAVGWWLWPRDELADTGASADGADAGLLVGQFPSDSDDAGFRGLAGHVIAHGAPVAGARVRLFFGASRLKEAFTCRECGLSVFDDQDPTVISELMASIRAGTMTVRAVAEVTTDADGAFSFDRAPQAGCSLLAVAPQGEAVLPLDATDEGTDWSDEVIELEAPPEQQQQVISASDQSPIGGATLLAFSPDTGQMQESRTDGHGVARFALAGEVWVAVEAPGFPVSSRLFSPDAPIELTPARTLHVHLRAAGQAVDGLVKLTVNGHARSQPSVGGEVTFTGLGGELVDVEASSRGSVAQSLNQGLEASTTELTLELRPGGTLLLTVIDELGQPLEAVDAQFTSNYENGGATVSGRGDGLRLGPFAEGEYQLTITSEGMNESVRKFDLKAGVQQLEVTLHRPHELTGVVVDEHGAPVDGADVALDDGFGAGQRVRTETDGAFTLHPAEAGRWNLTAEHADLGKATAVAQVPGPPLKVVLDKGAVVKVHLRDEAGQPLDGRVSSDVGWCEVEGGEGHLVGLKAGKATLTARSEGLLPASADVVLADHGVQEVSLVLKKGAAITGVVVDETGKLLAGIDLFGGGATTTSDDKGQFTLEPLTPGASVRLTILQDTRSISGPTLTAPAKDVRILVTTPRPVRGRAVDERGQALTQFNVDGEDVSPADGRFTAVPLERPLDDGGVEQLISLSAPGRTDQQRTVVGGEDVGDVVLPGLPLFHGLVEDAHGQPVSGVVVESNDFAGTGAVILTDSGGRFSAALLASEVFEVAARRGALQGKASFPPDTRTGTIRLSDPLHVVARLVGPDGHPVSGQVLVSAEPPENDSAYDTGPDGVAQFDLSPGRWGFATRASGAWQVKVLTTGPVEITLGAGASTCGLEVRLVGAPAYGAWLSADGAPPPAADELNGFAGASLIFASTESPLRMSAVPCGRYLLHVQFPEGPVEQPLALSGGLTQVEVQAPAPGSRPPEIIAAPNE